MKSKDVSDQILKGSEKGGKFYSFDESHDKSLPADMWFQESEEGEILFIVFYSQACRWSRCLGCNLPSKMSAEHVSYKEIVAQIDYIFQHPDVLAKRESIDKVIVSNNGSILDEDTLSSTALMYLLVRLNLNLPRVKVLSIETRPEYVDFAELEFISRALAESEAGTELEIAIGFEAFDEHVRNDVFQKGLLLDVFEEFVAQMAPFGYRLKCYFMQKPVPEMSDDDAVDDIKQAIDYLSDVSNKHNLPVNMHLNPTYAATGTELEKAFNEGKYSPPLLQDVARAVNHSKDKPISIYIGLSDEGLAVEGGSFIRAGDERLIEELELFNRTLDYEILDRIVNNGE